MLVTADKRMSNQLMCLTQNWCSKKCINSWSLLQELKDYFSLFQLIQRL